MHYKKIPIVLIFLSGSLYGFPQVNPSVSSGNADTTFVNALLEQSKENFQSQPDKAIILANDARALAEKIKFSRGVAYALKNIGIVYYLQGQYLKSLENFEHAFRIFDSLKDKRGSANILSNIGAIYYDKGDNTLALDYHLRSLKLSEEIEDKLRIATSMNNIGAVYINIKNNDKALEYLHKALIFSREVKDEPMIGTSSVNIGEVYQMKGLDDSALHYFHESLKAYKGTDDMAYTMNNIGKLYKKRKNFTLALKFQQQAYENAKKRANKLDMAKTLTFLGETYYQKGSLKNALECYRRAETLAIEIGSKNEKKIAYENLAKIYADLGEYDNAFKYQVMLDRIKDTFYNLESDKKISGLQFEFDIQKKQGEINFLKQEKDLREAQIKKEKFLRYGLFIGLALVFIIAFIQWRYNRQKQKANRLLQIQKIKTEHQKEKAEKALDELKAAEAQLIHSEKMASLGILTAGIAHEIKNPLNFINNFSEVSDELIKEMVEAVDKGNINEAKSIAEEVKQNIEKILHHGKRADSIVKGMLQHSRSSSGHKEPTDINALADEYLRLAYHGLRAKDKSFNATIKTDFDPSIGKINIIPQEIGRVVLNLISNAFYAAPLSSEGEFKDPNDKHEPTVWLSTKKLGDNVFISVKDNGPGIRQKILDKIFQPFFTTKPTGQGTGLGLSLSYDIVKAHGGELKVETKEGEGAEFIIRLPVT